MELATSQLMYWIRLSTSSSVYPVTCSPRATLTCTPFSTVRAAVATSFMRKNVLGTGAALRLNAVITSAAMNADPASLAAIPRALGATAVASAQSGISTVQDGLM